MKTPLLLLVVLSTTSFSPYKPKPSSTTQLRNDYIERLLSYKNSPYAPYGFDTGISCSTLVREALLEVAGIKKQTRRNILENPCPSEDLREGCDGELSVITDAANLKNLNYNEIQPGDIAVVGNKVGIHTLAYIGNETWIHADPITEKVIVSDIRDDDECWFNIKARVLRWNALKDK